MVEFQKLKIHNFMSFREQQTISLSRQGIVRLEGRNLDDPAADSNMAGKTAIIEALCWCLFNRTIRGLHHDQVIHRRVKKDCYVSVSFTVAETGYVCRRYRKHHKHQNQLQLWCGNHLLSFRHEELTQERVEEILGCDFQAFANSVIFGGMKPFAMMSDAEQKKLLESFLHFSRFDIALHRTKELLAEANEYKVRLSIQLERENGEAKTAKAEIQALRESEAFVQQKAQGELEGIRRKLQGLKKPKLKVTKQDVRKAEDEFEVLVQKQTKGEARVLQLRKTLKDYSKAVHNRKRLVGKPCPFCGARISKPTIEEFLSHIQTEQRGTMAKYHAAKHSVLESERRTTHGRKSLKRLHKQYTLNQQHLTRYCKEKGELEAQAGAKSVSFAPFSEKIEALSLKYTRCVSRLLVHEQEKKLLERRIQSLEFWEIGFGNRGVKSLIVREALPALNQKLDEYSKKVFHGGVELELSPTKQTKQGKERELFHLQYKARFGANSYVGESAGGRRRVDICVLLVFSWMSRLCNLLLVDELLDGLDDTGQKEILNILSELRGTILVISHENQLRSQISRTWRVTKHHGSSTLEQFS